MPFQIRLFLTLPLILVTLLVLRSGPASADWVQINKTDEGVTTYADPATIRSKGDQVKMCHLFDYTTPQINKGGNTHLSVKLQNEYDCAEERIRLLTAVRRSRLRSMTM